MTQANRLIIALRACKRGMTYGELESLKISTCPWKRLEESGHRFLRQGERLERVTGSDGLIRFVVTR